MYKANKDIYVFNTQKEAINSLTHNIGVRAAGIINSGSSFDAKITSVKSGSNTYKIGQVASEATGSAELPYRGSILNKFFVVTTGDMTKLTAKQVEESSKVAAKDKTKLQSQDSSGNIVTEIIYIDDAFTKEFSNYKQNLSDGLRVAHLRGIIGMPHQMLPITDPRLDSTESLESFGRLYSEKIVKPIPLLLLTPGTPSFMASYSESQRETLIGSVLQKLNIVSGELDKLVNENSGKYYSLKFAYNEYYQYINAMLRSAALFLDIGGINLDNIPLKNFNWLTYGSGNGEDTDVYGNEGLRKYLGSHAGAIPIYADVGQSVSESFSNGTTTSQIAGSLNGLSDMGREMNFLVGNIGGVAGLQLDRFTSAEGLEQNIQDVSDTIGAILGKGNIISNIVNKAQTLLAGGRMIFPEIWSDSTFSRSYNCNMKLISPSGDKLSIFLNILVPIFYLLGLTLPRTSTAQAYFSPFLIRGYYKGMFNIDMGIITDLSIEKGDEGYWTIDGLPTCVNISFSIKDLYSSLSMSIMELAGGPTSIISNIAELDYIGNCCGININEQGPIRQLKFYSAMVSDSIEDIDDKIFTGISEYLNNKYQSIFGRFK